MLSKNQLLFFLITVIVTVIVWFVIYSQKPQTLPRTSAGNMADLSLFKPYGSTTV